MSNFESEQFYKLVEITEAEAIFQLHSFPDAEELICCKGSVKRFGSVTAIKTDIFPGFSVNRVMGFTERPTEFLIDSVKEFYNHRQGIYALQIPANLIDELTDAILEAKGFIFKNSWVRFIRDTSPIEGSITDLQIREISISDGNVFGEMVTQIFDFPREIIPLVSSTVGRENWKFFMAFDKEKPVATGCVFVNGQMAWNCFATTLPEYRGRGAQGALLSARIEHARNAGCSYITTETHKDNASFRNMLRYGYKVLYERPNYVYGN